MHFIEQHIRTALQRADDVDRAILEFLLDRKDGEPPVMGDLPRLALYHGTPVQEIDGMLIDGICPQEHEILGGRWFCVSPNDNVLRFFGDDGTNGFAADDVLLPNCIFLGHRHIQLMLDVCCGDHSAKDEWESFFEDRGINYWRLRTEDFESAWQYLPRDLHAFVWPQCHEHVVPHYGWSGENSEAEISLTKAGCRLFQSAITQIVRAGNWEDRPESIQFDFPTLRYAGVAA